MGNLLAINGNIINSQEPLPIPVELMTKLWENPDPTANFAEQDISLSDSVTNYDFLLVEYKYHINNDHRTSSIFNSTSKTILSIGTANSNGANICQRNIVTVSGSTTSLHVEQCGIAAGTTAVTANNSFIIPLAIYGFKKTVSFVSGSNCDVEYKLVATGTTLDSLKAAIKALSRADYLKSYVNIVDDSLNAGNIMMMPEDGRDFVKAFGGISSPYNASYISRHWRVIYNANNDTISYGVYSQPVSGSMSEHTPNITAWYLYTLKPV